MTSLKRALIAIGAAGFAAGLVALALVLTSEWSRDDRTANLALGPLIGWAFITAGLIAWWRRPENRFGSLMTLVGFAWFAGALAQSDEPGVFIVGVMLGAIPFGVLIHMLLAFPAGKVEGRWPRFFVALAYFDVAVLAPIAFLFTQTHGEGGCDDCPYNPLLISDSGVGDVLFGIYGVVAVFGLIGVAVILWRRWRAASPALRRMLGALYLTGGATMVLTALTFVSDIASHTVAIVLNGVSIIVLATVPFAFLLGLLRTSLARAGAVSEIVAGTGDVRGALAEGVGDPSIELAYWLPDRRTYVDRDGRPIDLPEPGSGRATTTIEHDGRCVAAIIHDPVLNEQPGLVEAAGAAAALCVKTGATPRKLDVPALQEKLMAQGAELRRERSGK